MGESIPRPEQLIENHPIYKKGFEAAQFRYAESLKLVGARQNERIVELEKELHSMLLIARHEKSWRRELQEEIEILKKAAK